MRSTNFLALNRSNAWTALRHFPRQAAYLSVPPIVPRCEACRYFLTLP